MEVGYFYAVRGAIKQNQRMDSISNNLANANTVGFKQDKVSFGRLYHQFRSDRFFPGSFESHRPGSGCGPAGQGLF